MDITHIKTLLLAIFLFFLPSAHQEVDLSLVPLQPNSSQSTQIRPEQAPEPTQPQQEQTPEVTQEPVSGPPNTKLYILMYHEVVEDGVRCNDWMTTTSQLREDFQWLADHGYTTLLPSEVVRMSEAGTLPKRAVLVTFDDGYASNLKLALPILEDTHTRAVVSIITERIDAGDPGFLTWDMCRELDASPLVEIGSHTHTLHGTGEGIKRQKGESEAEYKARVLPDLQTSIDLIEENLGAKPRFLAYPHGIADPWAEDFLRENFDMTVTTKHGCADIAQGLYDLRRINVNTRETAKKFLPD